MDGLPPKRSSAASSVWRSLSVQNVADMAECAFTTPPSFAGALVFPRYSQQHMGRLAIYSQHTRASAPGGDSRIKMV